MTSATTVPAPAVCLPAPTPFTLLAVDLDHVALGLHDVTPVLDALVGELGAVVLDGGQSVGFRIVQVRLGMTVELMEPWAAERFDFLARFLDHGGEGPHHLTFKVGSIRDELARMAEAGHEPVRTNLDNPWWREAFFHPSETFGTVVQVAEATFDPALAETYDPGDAGEFGSVEWWPLPPPRPERRAVLRRVVLGVPDVGEAAAFYAGVLRGTPLGEGERHVELGWPGGGRVRFERRDGRPGVDRLECEWDGPPGERVLGGARIVLAPPG